MSTKNRAQSAWEPRGELTVLNTDIPRLDGPDKSTGRAKYAHDMRLPNMLYARLVLARIPRGTVDELDLSAAQALPGVVHVGAEKEVGAKLVYLGDDSVLAYVAAETPEQAKDAARAVRFALTASAPVVTRAQAIHPDAPAITDRGNVRAGRGPRNADEATTKLAASAFRVKGTYEVAVQHHVCLETHGCVVDWNSDLGEATVYASTQMVSGSNGMYAEMLGVDASKVRVVCQHMGGGFGSKFGPDLQGQIACKIAKAVGRPVHLMLDRPQEFQMAGNRSGTYAEIELGCDASGKITAVAGQVDRLGGIGGGSFPGLPYIYEGESAAVVRSVHTAMDSNRAMRAPGHPQASFVMESALDELAQLVGLDSFEIRMVNAPNDTWKRHLNVVADAIGWAAHPNKKKPAAPDADGWCEGIGFGLATWRASGSGGAQCEIRIERDGSVIASCGVQDLGTGARTYVAAIPAEEFGLEVRRVTPRIGDSTLPPGVASGGSVTTGSVAPVIKQAAHVAREAFEARLATTTKIEPGNYVWQGGRVRTKDGAFDVAFEDACALLGNTPVVGNAGFDESKHLLAEGRLHGAQAARVRVDTLTGRVQVVDMVAIQDQGIPLNRLALRSQINGGMIQALSFGLLEERVVDPELGLLLTDNLENYKIAGALEMPSMRSIIDDDDPRWAVTGSAEAPIIPGHSAIANAIFNACGARVRSTPFTPDKVLAALAARS
jgi:xanthine dehydrogenase YagR molybdenum-binding subunit